MLYSSSRYGYAMLVVAMAINIPKHSEAFYSIRSFRSIHDTHVCSIDMVAIDPETLLGPKSTWGKKRRRSTEKVDVIISPQHSQYRVAGYEINSNSSGISSTRKSLTPTNTRNIREQTSRIWSDDVDEVSNLSSTMPGFRVQEKDNEGKDESVTQSTMPGFNDKHRRSKKGKKSTDSREEKRLSQIKMYNGYGTVPESLIDFTAEIHGFDRVTPQREKELGLKSQEATHLQSVYDNLERSLGRQPTSDEWCAAAGKINMEALRQAIQDGLDAKNQLVTANLRLVQRVVNVYLRNGLGSRYNAGDLMQEGNIALIRAAEKFEPSRGFRFSTYAMYWIRSSIKRSQLMQSRDIIIPQRQHETYKKAQLISDRIEMETGIKPTFKELADEVGVPEKKLALCFKSINQEVYSLDRELLNNKAKNGPEGKTRLTDFVDAKSHDGDYFDAHRTLLRDDLIGVIRSALDVLEADVIMLRFGLIDERMIPVGASGPMSISEVSTTVGLKPDKVRRIINNSLTKLRPILKGQWLEI